MNLNDLLTRARAALPETSARPRRWSRLWPVYAELRARGFSCQRAVAWLAREGVVPEGEEGRALNAFHILATRRNKKDRPAPSPTVLPAALEPPAP
jgi:hypothetical protein